MGGGGGFRLNKPNRKLVEDRPGWSDLTWRMEKEEEPDIQSDQVGRSGVLVKLTEQGVC